MKIINKIEKIKILNWRFRKSKKKSENLQPWSLVQNEDEGSLM